MKHLGDITKIDWSKVEPVDVVTGGSPCVTADSLILTKDGYAPILDINVGDEVLTKSNTWQRVAKKFSNGVHETCFISGHGFENIHCTLNHKFYARTSRRYGHYGKRIFSEPEFVEAKDLTSKHYIGLPVIETERQFYTNYSEFWWFIGYYLGDGWLKTQRSEICLACNAEKLEKIKQHMPQEDWRYTVQNSGTCLKLRFCNKAIYDFISANIGTGSSEKRITADIINLPKNLLMQLFNGYLDSDGCKIKGYYQFSTVNRSMAYGMSLIINKLFHRPCCIYKVKTAPKTRICGREVNQHDWYQLRFSTESHRQDHSFYEDGYLWLQFRKRINAGAEPVYNMEVENDHSYILQGIISKNCQDLSVAGKRAGLAGERSGLYMEQIKCCKELRKYDKLRGRAAESIRPRYMVWENVPGAFSSNKGGDFAAVLEEAIRVVEPEAPDVPVPEKGWPYSGYIYDELGRWSVAWRTHDAQFWGTALWPLPQRRRRISLVCDFGGLSAGEILFKQESLPWHSPESGEEGEAAAKGTGSGLTDAGRSDARCAGRRIHGTDVSTGLNTVTGADIKPISFQGQAGSEASLCIGHDIAASLVAQRTEMVYTPKSIGCDIYNGLLTGDTACTLTAAQAIKNASGPSVLENVVAFTQNQRDEVRDLNGIAGSLAAEPGMKQQTFVAHIPNEAVYIDTTHADDVVRVDHVTAPLQARDYKGGKLICMATSSVNAEITDNDISPSLLARAGTGGNQLPLVCNGKKATVYGLCSFDSNAMKSKNPHSGIYEASTSRTLDLNGGNPACNQGGMMVVQNNAKGFPMQAIGEYADKDVASSLKQRDYKDATDLVVQTYGVTTKGNGDAFISKEKHTSLSCGGGEAGQGYPCVLTPMRDSEAVCIENGQSNQSIGEVTGAINCMHDQQAVYVPNVSCFQNTGQGWWNKSDIGATLRTPCGGDALKANLVSRTIAKGVDFYNQSETGEISKTLSSAATDSDHIPCVRGSKSVRRLTPLECERLQGYPNRWTLIGEPELVEVKDYTYTYDEDGNETSKTFAGTRKELQWFYTDIHGKKKRCNDGARYKALGNSIALPFWYWLLLNISKTYTYTPTLGSLFDGISGFCLCWESINGPHTAKWVSEIEEFPIAVVKQHFGDEDTGLEGDLYGNFLR